MLWTGISMSIVEGRRERVCVGRSLDVGRSLEGRWSINSLIVSGKVVESKEKAKLNIVDFSKQKPTFLTYPSISEPRESRQTGQIFQFG